MRVPSGYSEIFKDSDEDEILELLKPIYGLVQAARLFWLKMVGILTNKLHFKEDKVDPCLLTRIDKRGTVTEALYVDDCICI